MLEVRGLHASAGGREVLHGIDLTVRSGEVHVIMGPNGSGKSTLAHALMGRPGTEVTAGSIAMDGHELAGLPAWQRARAGLFLALQHPVEVPGVGLPSLLAAAGAGAGTGAGGGGVTGHALAERMADEAKAVGLDPKLLNRALNLDLSGGERKRTEMVQLGVLRPAICILDEVDSGLDVDALGEVARRLQARNDGVGCRDPRHHALQPFLGGARGGPRARDGRRGHCCDGRCSPCAGARADRLRRLPGRSLRFVPGAP